jgi:hypothetical protein
VFAGGNRRFSVSFTDEVASPSYFQQFSDITEQDSAAVDVWGSLDGLSDWR